MDILDISTCEKHSGKTLKEIYCGRQNIQTEILDASIRTVISWFLPPEQLDYINIQNPRIKIEGLSKQETKFINLTIRKSLNYYFSNDEDAWDCRKFDELNVPVSYRSFLSVQGDPCHIKWLIENESDFYIPEFELNELEKLPVYRFSKFHLIFISDELLKFKPLMKAFFFRFPEKIRVMNRRKMEGAIIE